jgi:hypothetical protein
MQSIALALVLALFVFLFSAVGLPEHASAAEPDEIGAAEGGQTPSQPISTDAICGALAAAAEQNDLPTDFFTRLIWQESRFDPAAVSRAGAQGVAQFMPATANWRGLSNPFDPLEAIAQSAKLLRDLRREFGNLGLAAAAYNARLRASARLARRQANPSQGDTRLCAYRDWLFTGAMGWRKRRHGRGAIRKARPMSRGSRLCRRHTRTRN